MDGHRARKRFGQHFLVDAGVIDSIVREVAPQPGDRVLEIGPGLGALTHPLRQRLAAMAADGAGDAPALTVIELDRDLAARWRRQPGVAVIESDVLAVDLGAAADGGRPWRIVGNLPYNISTPILFHLLTHASAWRDAVLMLQKEVVDRMAAAPGSRDYGRLTVMLQWRAQVEPLFDVPPQAFDPPPKVWSSMVRLVPRPPEATAGIDEALLGEMVTAAFSQRRKLLRHGLGRWFEARGQTLPDGFDAQRRAEEVPVEEFLALAAHAGPGGPPTRVQG